MFISLHLLRNVLHKQEELVATPNTFFVTLPGIKALTVPIKSHIVAVVSDAKHL